MITKVAHLTDLHLDDKISGDFFIDARSQTILILNDILKQNIQYIIITGDLGLSSSFEWLNNELTKRNLISYFAIGNHDDLYLFKSREEYKQTLTKDKLLYEIIINGNKIIIFDTGSGEVDTLQRDIIVNLIKENDFCILFSHYPILDCGNTIMDQLFPLKDRELFVNYISRYSKKIVYFCGHYHNRYEVIGHNISQYVTPSASLQISKYTQQIEKENNLFGYRIIEIENSKLIKTDVIMLSIDKK